MDVEWKYGGRVYVLPAMKQVELPEAVGKHLLGKLSKRGIVEAKYGMTPKRVAEISRVHGDHFEEKALHDYEKMLHRAKEEGVMPPVPSPFVAKLLKARGIDVKGLAPTDPHEILGKEASSYEVRPAVTDFNPDEEDFVDPDDADRMEGFDTTSEEEGAGFPG